MRLNGLMEFDHVVLVVPSCSDDSDPGGWVLAYRLAVRDAYSSL